MSGGEAPTRNTWTVRLEGGPHDGQTARVAGGASVLVTRCVGPWRFVHDVYEFTTKERDVAVFVRTERP